MQFGLFFDSVLWSELVVSLINVDELFIHMALKEQGSCTVYTLNIKKL